MNLRRRSRAKLRLLFSDKRLHRSEADLRSGVAAAEPSVPVLLAIKVGGQWALILYQIKYLLAAKNIYNVYKNIYNLQKILYFKNISHLQHNSELEPVPNHLGSLSRLVSRHTSLVAVPEPRPAPAPAPPSRSFSLCHSNKYKVSGRHLPQHLVHLSYLHFLARSDLLL